MRFMHIADVHLGMKPDSGYPWSDKRASEIFETFTKIIDICNEDNIELLIIAGDLFHKQPRDGDVVIMCNNSFYVDEDATKERKNKINSLMKGMWEE